MSASTVLIFKILIILQHRKLFQGRVHPSVYGHSGSNDLTFVLCRLAFSSVVQWLTNLGQCEVLIQEMADLGLYAHRLTKVGSVGEGTRICFLK